MNVDPAAGSGSGHLRTFAWIGLALVCALYLGRLGGFVLQDPDEGRYAEIPREMIETGDWVTPRLNYVKYFEKPPLLYWLTGASFLVFGPTEGAARVVPALSGIATILLAYFLGRSMFGPRAGLIGAAILATSPLFFVLSQVLIIDMLLTAAITATLAAVWAAHRAEDKGRFAVLAAVATAVGVLAKGPVALVLAGGVALLYLLARRDFATLRAFLRPAPLLAFAVIAAPWFVLVSLRNPEFVEFFFVREHFQRFASKHVGHPEGPFFYLPILLGGPLPWTLLALPLAGTRAGRAALGGLPRDAVLFLGLWFVVVVGFFSVASSKLPPYVLPALPPLAMLAGAGASRLLDEAGALRGPLRWMSWCIGGAGVILLAASPVALLAAGPIAPRFHLEPAGIRGVGWTAVLLGAAFVATAALILRERSPGNRTPVAGIAILAVGMGCALFVALGARDLAKTTRNMADAIAAETADGSPYSVLTYRRMMQSLMFYTGGRVTMLDPHDSFNEIDHLARLSPDFDEHFWTDPRRLAELWKSGRKGFVATDLRMAPELASVLDPEPRILARDGKRVLLVNFPAPGAPAVEAPGRGG